ncbi:MAG TPA: ATP-grasp domain-containing protein, partial [Haliscomenobacter sp.]|nr:ATP-grasp domain-containing protein [Haliscomenobacter sp.]
MIKLFFSKKILTPLNYRGFFGLDFLVSENQVYLLECNPRLTASFAFYTQIELKNDLTPLFYFDLAEFINLDYQIDLLQEQSRFYNQNIIGSEIT